MADQEEAAEVKPWMRECAEDITLSFYGKDLDRGYGQNSPRMLLNREELIQIIAKHAPVASPPKVDAVWRTSGIPQQSNPGVTNNFWPVTFKPVNTVTPAPADAPDGLRERFEKLRRNLDELSMWAHVNVPVGLWAETKQLLETISEAYQAGSASASPLSDLAERIVQTRTAWLESHGVPISQEFANFIESVGNVVEALRGSASPSARCGEPAGSLIAGASWFACVLPKGHAPDTSIQNVNGHRRGGNCFAHGEYVGNECPKWPNCIKDQFKSASPPENPAV